MTKADMRVKKSLTKIRHALCKILSSTPELTDYNFTVRIIAKTAPFPINGGLLRLIINTAMSSCPGLWSGGFFLTTVTNPTIMPI